MHVTADLGQALPTTAKNFSLESSGSGKSAEIEDFWQTRVWRVALKLLLSVSCLHPRQNYARSQHPSVLYLYTVIMREFTGRTMGGSDLSQRLTPSAASLVSSATRGIGA